MVWPGSTPNYSSNGRQGLSGVFGSAVCFKGLLPGVVVVAADPLRVRGSPAGPRSAGRDELLEGS